MCRSIFIQSLSSLLLMLVLLLLLEDFSLCSRDFDYDYEHQHEHEQSKKNTLDTCQRLPSAEGLLPLDARVVELADTYV